MALGKKENKLMKKVYAHAAAASIAAATIAWSVAGCSRPQASSPENLHLIGSLRTAISARNPQWLEDNSKVLEARHAAGKMAEAEYEEFRSIIATAKDGRWEAAEQEVIKFVKSQRATAEQVERATKHLK